ncbi:MAG: hypothetical protein IH944_01035 [Armatimonadetes bacterium]|nr:hypothetical protein [Armatimonadota bacterium]
MFPVTPIDGAVYYGDRPVPEKPEMDMTMFMRLLTVQLLNQNPLEPMSDGDFFGQIAQLGQVQGMDRLNDSMDTLQGASLIGKTVTAVRPFTGLNLGESPIVTGTVVQLTVRNGERILGLREANGGIVEVNMTAIQSIRE